MLTALGFLISAVAQINVAINDDGKPPAIRRTDPRDEPALIRIVEQGSVGAMSALFALGYLRDPSPRAREALRGAARSNELLTSYPAICSLWRIDDAEWRALAADALPRLAMTQRLHVATLLFRAGEYSRWPLLRAQLADLLAIPGSEDRLKADVFQIVASAWQMRDDDGEGAALRDLRRQLASKPADIRERAGRMLKDFVPPIVE